MRKYIAGQLELAFMSDYPKPPKTDNEKILLYQKEYREGKRDGAKNLFYTLRACAKRFIYHEREMKGFYISSEDANEKATIAAEYILEQYITRPTFELGKKADGSPGKPSGYVYLRVLAALYRHKKIDEFVRYTDREF